MKVTVPLCLIPYFFPDTHCQDQKPQVPLSKDLIQKEKEVRLNKICERKEGMK